MSEIRENRILTAWRENRVAVNGWLHSPSSYSAELIANLPYDCVTVDLQHGMIDFQVALSMLQAISTKDPTPIVRVPWNDPAIVMKVLDAGAYGVICPMVNTRAECEQFVGACRYPPVGYRSNGAHRAVLYGGRDYVKHANQTIVTFAMIETREAMDNLDDILAVDELDGVFVGPTDLAFSLGCAVEFDPRDPELVAAIDRIVQAAKRHGKKAGIVSPTGAVAKRMIEAGFDLVTPGTETTILENGARAELAQVRGT